MPQPFTYTNGQRSVTNNNTNNDRSLIIIYITTSSSYEVEKIGAGTGPPTDTKHSTKTPFVSLFAPQQPLNLVGDSNIIIYFE